MVTPQKSAPPETAAAPDEAPKPGSPVLQPPLVPGAATSVTVTTDKPALSILERNAARNR